MLWSILFHATTTTTTKRGGGDKSKSQLLKHSLFDLINISKSIVPLLFISIDLYPFVQSSLNSVLTTSQLDLCITVSYTQTLTLLIHSVPGTSRFTRLLTSHALQAKSLFHRLFWFLDIVIYIKKNIYQHCDHRHFEVHQSLCDFAQQTWAQLLRIKNTALGLKVLKLVMYKYLSLGTTTTLSTWFHTQSVSVLQP